MPTVFSHQEALAVLNQLSGSNHLATSLMYGSGLRVMETARLRIQDIDFDNNCIVVRESKGLKWRRTLLPKSLGAKQIAHESNSPEAVFSVTTASEEVDFLTNEVTSLINVLLLKYGFFNSHLLTQHKDL